MANVFNQASNALTGALKNTRQVANNAGANLGFGASTVAGTNLNQYMNPYTSQVISASMNDLNQARQTAMNDVGAQATAAGAFGGARHGLVEAQTNQNFADSAAQMASGLRQDAYNTALNSAQFDATQQQNAAAQNAQNTLAGRQLQLSAAGQQGNLGNMGFGMGQQVQQMQNTAGAQQQQINQALIDAGRQQYAGYQQAPYQGLAALVSALGGAPAQGSQTTSSNPGLLGVLAGGASILGSLCWVSRAAFGADNPEWLKVRKYMLTDAPKWLFNAYVKHGPDLADWIERHPVTKPLFRAALRRLVA